MTNHSPYSIFVRRVIVAHSLCSEYYRGVLLQPVGTTNQTYIDRVNEKWPEWMPMAISLVDSTDEIIEEEINERTLG